MIAAEHPARVQIVVSLCDHYGRNPLPSTVAEIVGDTERFTLEILRQAAAEVRRTQESIHGASLSALLSSAVRRLNAQTALAANGRALAAPTEPRATPEERRAIVARVAASVRNLSRSLTP